MRGGRTIVGSEQQLSLLTDPTHSGYKGAVSMSEQSNSAPLSGQPSAYILGLDGHQIGAFKRAAKLAGLLFDEYLARLDAGQKRCIRCRQWKPVAVYQVDASRWDGRAAKCRDCANRLHRERYVPVQFDQVKTPGPQRHAPKDGDKLQARHLINQDVQRGLRPDPNSLHCVYCGHFGSDLRHEYHHYMGYSARHHYDVVPACSKCHHVEDSANGHAD
jgi:hypothetical protein